MNTTDKTEPADEWELIYFSDMAPGIYSVLVLIGIAGFLCISFLS